MLSSVTAQLKHVTPAEIDVFTGDGNARLRAHPRCVLSSTPEKITDRLQKIVLLQDLVATLSETAMHWRRTSRTTQFSRDFHKCVL
jgi:hypothetical protein